MDDDLKTAERQGKTRRIVHAQAPTYESEALRDQYVRLTEKAQDAFLDKDFKGAKRLAMQAMRIRPTSHLFGLCAAIADAVGNFNESADFRLLQAFQADDAELWKELLNEFLENSLWFKATVCLKRLSALAPPRSQQRHDIQLQLADLLVALGEHRSATTIYRNLWVQSNMKDFEVFATLSSLLFQLGRWNALDELLRESTTVFLKNEVAKQIKDTTAGDDANAADNEDDAKLGSKRPRQSKPKLSGAVIDALLKGSGVSSTDLKQKQKQKSAIGASQEDGAAPPPTSLGLRAEGESSATAKNGDFDTFDNFDELFGEEGEFLGERSMFLGGTQSKPAQTATATAVSSSPDGLNDDAFAAMFSGAEGAAATSNSSATLDSSTTPSIINATATNDSDFDFTGGGNTSGDAAPTASSAPAYDPFIELTEPDEIRNYLSLINVHTELLNERGQFSSTVQLIALAASHLRMPILDMNADILLKLAVAHAYLGNMTSSEGVVKRLVETCPPAQYGDVLFDAAETLSKIGAFSLSRTIYQYLLRYSRMEDRNNAALMAEQQAAAAGGGSNAPTTSSVGLSAHYALRQGESLDMLRDRIDRDVALLFGIARCAANQDPFAPFQWYAVNGLTTPPLLASPTGTGAAVNGGFPTDPSTTPLFSASSSASQQAAALARQHPAMAALLEIHEQLDPFHAPTRILLSQLYRHEFKDYVSAEKVLMPPKALFKAPDSSTTRAHGGDGAPSLFADPLGKPAASQSLSSLNNAMAAFALNNDPSLLRESGLQRTQCDVELMTLLADLGPSKALALLKCGVPFFDRLFTTAQGDDEDAESVVAGGKKSRAPSLSLPSLSRASSAIVPASRVAGSLAGDNGPATSTLLSTTRSIATSARSSTAGGKLLLRTRGVSAGSSYITSSATTALTVAGSRVGPASTVAEMLEGKDSTGIFRFHRTTNAMKKAVVGAGAARRGGGGGGASVAAVGKRIKKAVKKMDITGDEGGRGVEDGEGGSGGATSSLLQSGGGGGAIEQLCRSTKRSNALNERREKARLEGTHSGGGEGGHNPLIRTRSEILEQQPQRKQQWEVSSVGNLGDIALMEEVMMASDEEKEDEDEDENDNAENEEAEDEDTATANRDDEGFLLPSMPTAASSTSKKSLDKPTAKDTNGKKKSKKTKEVVDDALPSIDDVIAHNFAGDPTMADLFRSVTEGKRGEEGEEAAAGGEGADSTGATPNTLMVNATAPPAPKPSEQQQQQPSPVTAALPTAMPVAATVHDKRPPAADVVRLFGKSRLVKLALAMMDAYGTIGDHVEAKNFGLYFLLRMKDFFKVRHTSAGDLVVPIRLAILRQSLLSGDVSSAVRSTVSILQQEGRNEDPTRSLFGAGSGDTANASSSSSTTTAPSAPSIARDQGLLVGTAHQRHLWETFAVLINGGLKPRILLRLITDKGRRDFELLCIFGNQHYNCGSFSHALKYYLVALEQRPKDPLLLFLIALCFLHVSVRRTTVYVNNMLQNAFYYLQEYYTVVSAETPSRVPEAIYNIARAYQYLTLGYLAEPLYTRVITMLEQEGVGLMTTADLLRYQHQRSNFGGGGGEDSPFAAEGASNLASSVLNSSAPTSNSGFYGFINISEDAPEIDASIRKGFGLDGSEEDASRGAVRGVGTLDQNGNPINRNDAHLTSQQRAARQDRFRQAMLLQAAKFNLAMLYRKGGHNEALALKTLSAVLQ